MVIVPDRVDRAQGDVTVPIPWSDFVTELLALYQPPMVAQGPAGKMASVLRELTALLGPDATTADLTVTLVTKVIAGRPPSQSPYTLQGILAVVRTITTYAETAGYVRTNPFRLRKLTKWIRLPKLPPKRCPSREEIRLILDLAARHVAERTGWAQWRARRLLVVIATVAYTGVRKMECLRLEIGDVDLANGVIWIRPHGAGGRLKTSASEQPIPIPPALRPYLTDWSSHRLDGPIGFPVPAECPYFIPTLSRKAPWVSGQPGGKALNRLQAVALLAGVQGVTFQSLRRAWATHAEYYKLGEAMIQRVLRHTTMATSKKHYRQAEIANMNEAVKDFDF